MPQPTPEQIAELEAKHGRVAVIRGRMGNDGEPAWCCVLRKPSRPEYKKWRADTNDPQLKADAQEMFFRTICVWPEPGPLLDEWPGVAEACGDAMLDLTGAAGKADAK